MPKRCILDLAPQRSPRAHGGRKIAFDAGSPKAAAPLRVAEPAVLSRRGRLLSAQPRVALGSASRRLARPLSLWPRRAGQTISPANLHDRVYEPYGSFGNSIESTLGQ